jgi:hypothetical protein
MLPVVAMLLFPSLIEVTYFKRIADSRTADIPHLTSAILKCSGACSFQNAYHCDLKPFAAL